MGQVLLETTSYLHGTLGSSPPTYLTTMTISRGFWSRIFGGRTTFLSTLNYFLLVSCPSSH